MARVIALLDHPQTISLGLVPFVLESEDGLLMCGFKGGPRPLTRDRLQEGEALGSVLRVEGPNIQLDTSKDLAAGWLGTEFEQKRCSLDAPSCAIETKPLYEVEGGQYWIGGSERIIGMINRWIGEAARVAIARPSAELAELMEMASPGHPDTRAALLVTRKTEMERREELEWFARLERDSGHPIHIEELERRLMDRADEIRDVATIRKRGLQRSPRPRNALAWNIAARAAHEKGRNELRSAA